MKPIILLVLLLFCVFFRAKKTSCVFHSKFSSRSSFAAIGALLHCCRFREESKGRPGLPRRSRLSHGDDRLGGEKVAFEPALGKNHGPLANNRCRPFFCRNISSRPRSSSCIAKRICQARMSWERRPALG